MAAGAVIREVAGAGKGADKGAGQADIFAGFAPTSKPPRTPGAYWRCA